MLKLVRLVIHQEDSLKAVAIGFLDIIVSVITPRFAKIIPRQLMAIVVASVVASLAHLNIPRIIDLHQFPISIYIIAHNHCVMSDPHVKRGAFISALTGKHGWSGDQATSFFDQHAKERI